MNRNCFSTIAAVVFTAVLVSCGGGTDPVVTTSQPRPSIRVSVASPVKKATTVAGGDAVVIHMYQALYGMAPSNALLLDYAFQANNDASTFVKNLTDRFASTSHADLAKLVLDNLGVTPTTVPAINAKGDSEYALLADAVKQLLAAYPTMRGQVILNMTNLLAGLQSDITYGKAAIAFNAQANVNTVYSSNEANTFSNLSSSKEVSCTYVKPASITYPSEYNGAYPIPVPAGRLPASVTRSIGLSDAYLGKNNSRMIPTGSSCIDATLYARNQYIGMLNQLQQDGAEQIWIANYGAWDDWSTPILTVSRENYHLQENDIKFIVDEAKKRNIQVFYNWTIITNDMLYHEVPPLVMSSTTKEALQRMLSSYHKIIVSQAIFSEQIGIAGITADAGGVAVLTGGSIDPVIRELYTAEMVSIIDDIRKVFSGKVLYGAGANVLGWYVLDPRIISKIDTLIVQISPYTDNLSTPISVETFKPLYLADIAKTKASYDKQMKGAYADIPIQWETGIFSLQGYYWNGWMEPGCKIPCAQQTTMPDFSIQAIGWEAALEAIREQTYFKTGTVNVSSYWFTDDLLPFSISDCCSTEMMFASLSPSIRNKPVENIVKYWFGK